MKKIFTKKVLIISIIILVLVVGYFMSTGREEESIYETVTAEKQTLVQEINATGRVTPIDSIELAFEKSGRVNILNIDVGDTVYAGQVLVSLEKNESLADLAQARASVESAEATLQQYEAVLATQQAVLNQLNAGTRDEELFLYQSKVDTVEIAILSAQDSLINAIQDAYTRSEDAVLSKADKLFNNPTSPNPQLKFAVSDSSMSVSVNSSRLAMGNLLALWRSDLDILSVSSDFETMSIKTRDNLSDVRSYLEKVSTALNYGLVTEDASQALLDTWKVDISGARTSINLAITSHSTAKEKYDGANTSLTIAENELSLKLAGSVPEQIEAQEATILQALANISSQKAQIKLKESAVQSSLVRLAKNTLTSPIAGIVVDQNTTEGAIVGIGQIIVKVISEGKYEIEALVVEADIADLTIGNTALLSLDAYGDDEIFEAVVINIEPAAELIEGVANYRVTLTLSVEDERLRSGMTADIDIVTAKRADVVVIPQRAVIFRGSEKFVRVLNNNVMSEVEVTTGITGGRGLIEIVSGINEGDVVVTAVKK